MKPFVIKVRNEKRGDHVHMTFWTSTSPDGDTLGNIGTLVGRIVDYQTLQAMIILGTRHSMGRVVFEQTEDSWNPAKEKE